MREPDDVAVRIFNVNLAAAPRLILRPVHHVHPQFLDPFAIRVNVVNIDEQPRAWMALLA